MVIFFFLFSFRFLLLFGHLVIPPVHILIVAVRHRIVKRAAADRATISRQLAAEVRVVIQTGLVESGDVTISTTPLAVCLGVMCIEIVAA